MDNRTFFHLAAFSESVAIGATTQQIDGVPDGILTRSASNNFLAPDGCRLFAATGLGTNLTRMRINTPVARYVAFPQIAPTNAGTTVPSPANLSLFENAGIKPNASDEIAIEAGQNNAAAQIERAGLWLMFQRKEPTPGVKYRTRFTATITAVAESWASGAITFDQTIPAGIYQIQGMQCFGANLFLSRLIFPGGGWRPGVLCNNLVSDIPRREFTDGTFGVFGEFNSVNVPQLEILSTGANTAQEGFLDLVRTGDY